MDSTENPKTPVECLQDVLKSTEFQIDSLTTGIDRRSQSIDEMESARELLLQSHHSLVLAINRLRAE